MRAFEIDSFDRINRKNRITGLLQENYWKYKNILFETHHHEIMVSSSLKKTTTLTPIYKAFVGKNGVQEMGLGLGLHAWVVQSLFSFRRKA